MHRISLLTLAGLLVLTSANAQTIAIRAPDGTALPAGQTTPTRIQVQMTISQRVTTGGVEEQRRVEEAVRRALYEMAVNECSVIAAVFKTGCRIASLNVNSNAQERNDTLFLVSGNASGQYELTPQQ